ncbi:cell division protein FtsZ [Inquilinus sp. CAU 1745]|uniref:cell division protein FtsZ n=1 Tax=Inquilinus sp. CAU 1745 TaxID=3140369 RepID=UPI00325B781C
MINLGIPQNTVQMHPRITVVGVGGAGGNAVNNMIKSNLEGVEFLVANTDAQSVQGSLADRKIQLGNGITQGLGAGSRPDIGRAAAEEALEEVISYLEGSHMVFITAGMGGGTGTGAAPVIARAAREQGILTVGVVTKPFHFEGAHRMRIAEAGLNELQQYVDTLIVIPNQNLFRIANEKTTFADAFKMADDVLHSGVRGVTDLMVMPGLINLDFADIRTVMSEMGKAMMGTGEAEGDRRSVMAAEAAISNPLLDDVSMKGARGVLINITGGLDMTLYEVDEAANRIRDEVDADANIIFGSTFDESMEGRVRVSVVSTGIDLEAAAGNRPGVTNLSLVSDRTAKTAPEAPRPAAGGFSAATAMRQPSSVRQQPMGGAPSPAARASAGPAMASAAALKQPEPYEEHMMGEAEMQAEPEAIDPMSYAEPLPEAPRAERREGNFIAPRPMEAPARAAGPAYGHAEGHGRGMVDTARRGFSLFRQVTGLMRDGEDAHHAPAEHRPAPQQAAAPAPAPRQAPPATSYGQPAQPAQTRFSGFDNSRGPLPSAEDEQLDIPAFLRRQAN